MSQKQAYDTTGAYAAAEMIKLNKKFYDDLLAGKDSWTLVKRETIRPNSGIAVYVDAGYLPDGWTVGWATMRTDSIETSGRSAMTMPPEWMPRWRGKCSISAAQTVRGWTTTVLGRKNQRL